MTVPVATPVPEPASNQFKAVIRGLMPFVYSFAAAAIAHLGYKVSLQSAAVIVGGAGAGLSIVLHAAETRWRWMGAFLGYIGAPVYTPVVSSKAKIAQLEATVASLLAAQDEAANPSTPTVAASPPISTPVVAEVLPAPGG